MRKTEGASYTTIWDTTGNSVRFLPKGYLVGLILSWVGMPSSASAETLPGGGQGAKQSCAPRRTPRRRSRRRRIPYLLVCKGLTSLQRRTDLWFHLTLVKPGARETPRP
jgi:hypothetical protein